MQRVGASLKMRPRAVTTLHSREPRVGNPFARKRKFSGKICAIHRQLVNEKGTGA
jgi:hypothetical protein